MTGIVAYVAAASGFYQTIAAAPLIWLVMLAPLGFVLVLSFSSQRMSTEMAMALFWIYATSWGLSLGSIFLVFTGNRSRGCSLSPLRPMERQPLRLRPGPIFPALARFS